MVCLRKYALTVEVWYDYGSMVVVVRVRYYNLTSKTTATTWLPQVTMEEEDLWHLKNIHVPFFFLAILFFVLAGIGFFSCCEIYVSLICAGQF